MTLHAPFTVPLAGGGQLVLGSTPIVMGIVNVTPDSFSDGGDRLDPQDALNAAQAMIAQGASIIDIGGESTRPGADSVSIQDELDRVMPALDAFADAKLGAVISIDTRHALVADQALQAGAHIVNDVEGLHGEPQLAGIAAAHNAPVIAMHWDKTRDTSKDIIGEMRRFFEETLHTAQREGLAEDQVILDPGFGFAKSFAENYEILRRLGELQSLGRPLLAGMSRKSMFGKLLGVTPKQRVAATVASSVIAYQASAHIFRVHDVQDNVDGLRVAQATIYGPPEPIQDA